MECDDYTEFCSFRIDSGFHKNIDSARNFSRYNSSIEWSTEMKLKMWCQAVYLPAFFQTILLWLSLACLFSLGLAACSPVSAHAEPGHQTATAAIVPATATQANTATPSPTATVTPTQPPTALPGPTLSPTPLPTPTWVEIPAHQTLTVPILMYHHITDVDPGTRYSVTLANFRAQMELLQAHDFTPITITELANVLWDGGQLPAHPVVITFDDGNQDVFDNGFPILNEFGFRAVMYVVADRLHCAGFLNADRLKELTLAGWEIGSHTMTHANLSNAPLGLNVEMYQSRVSLSQDVGVEVLSLAYPYTIADSRVFAKVSAYGYRSAVCAGPTNQQSLNNIYCLYRREVEGSLSLADFSRLLGLSD
jgi:peptidoglycan/xylan/chitin deacetylase (PgdA/CDA1 family)